jgi:flagellar biosynthetic protein FlhB
MAGDRTEKPTPRRIQKARQDGRFPVSREALNALTFALAIWLLVRYAPDWLLTARDLSVFLIRRGFTGELHARAAAEIWRLILAQGLAPLLLGGCLLTVVALAAQAGMTGFGFAGKQLGPQIGRLNPVNRLKQLPAQNLQSVLQGAVLLAVFGFLIAWRMPDWLGLALRLPRQALAESLAAAGAEVATVLKYAALLFLAFGAVDFTRQRFRYYRELRMTKQEVRDEYKESEGNPQIKQRIRRLQREAARKQMMAQVPKAAAVIVNPTHYAVAIEYRMESMAAPRVVAKGRNYLARRIREIALEHEIPIVENPPLARSLYRHVEVGHEIPVDFYRAVAEVLAYIYRLMNGRGAAR